MAQPRDVQAAINAAANDLPINLPSPPTYRKVNPADAPIMILAMTSDTLPGGEEIFEYGDNIVEPETQPDRRRQPGFYCWRGQVRPVRVSNQSRRPGFDRHQSRTGHTRNVDASECGRTQGQF